MYRPCSRESIAKMIGKVGVGKGLNVKGKSAQMNRLSGFVPFVQILDNTHKVQVEAPADGPACGVHVYFRSAAHHAEAREALMAWLEGMVLPKEEVASPLTLLTLYKTSSTEPSFGLAVPESLFAQFYRVLPTPWGWWWLTQKSGTRSLP